MNDFEDKLGMLKVARINEQLDKRYGLRISTNSTEHLEHVKEHYLAKRDILLRKYGISEALALDDYAKAVMISEAATLFLREIAPTRRKRTRKEVK